MNQKPYTTITSCRACGSQDLQPLFSLGEQAVSDFVEQDQIDKGIKCPIELVLCRACTLVQQKHSASSDFMYTRHYWYRSGVTETMRAALADVVRAASSCVDLRPGDVVLDIGSNDGTLLNCYNRPDIGKIGVEPAANLATRENYPKGAGAWVLNDFWDADKYFDFMVGNLSTRTVCSSPS